MKRFRRWASGVVTSFDWMLSQVENHDALVSSAIHEVKEAGARAKVQLKRVKRDGQKMKKKLHDLREAEETWRDRAIRIAKVDEKKALECVRRKNKIQKEIQELEVQVVEHSKLEKNLSEDLGKIDDRISRLHQQQNLLRTRQSRAEALSAMRQDDSVILSEIDEIFDRWEIKVTEYEIQGACDTDSGDSLEGDFIAEEEEQDLRTELDALLSDSAQS